MGLSVKGFVNNIKLTGFNSRVMCSAHTTGRSELFDSEMILVSIDDVLGPLQFGECFVVVATVSEMRRGYWGQEIRKRGNDIYQDRSRWSSRFRTNEWILDILNLR